MSIRTWLDPYPQQFRSTSNDTGYTTVRYANGVYVAVGHQVGFPLYGGNVPNGYPTAGSPVSAAGCCWSTDGENWTDARLPFRGTSTCYTTVACNGSIWLAVGQEIVNGQFAAVYARSLDNGRTWAADPAGYRSGIFLLKAIGGAGSFLVLGQRAPPSQWNACSERGTTGLAANMTQAVLPAIVARLNAGAVIPTAGPYWLAMGGNAVYASNNNMASFAEVLNPAYGNGLSSGTTPREPLHCIVALGQFWALISDSSYQTTPRGRNIWSSDTGSVWTLRASLPISATQGPYYELGWNGRVMVAVGDGICMASRDGVNWRETPIPSGSWRGIASDGKDFVVVSQNGDRLKVSGVSLEGRVS
jgi:hypothetical protein